MKSKRGSNALGHTESMSPSPEKTGRENNTLLKPIKRVRLYENAVEQIKSLILEKKYKPGDRLPAERSLAEQLSISRHSLREALRILDVMGLLDIRVGDGIYVKEVDFLPYRIVEPLYQFQAAHGGRQFHQTVGGAKDS